MDWKRVDKELIRIGINVNIAVPDFKGIKDLFSIFFETLIKNKLGLEQL